ncbi:MAG TPA: DUF1552 domain-containing protein [Chthoniobacteraceae bacterium]|jgi:hypothetical protein|nr:DUF1552 domain-containing protein [Chthoniobacteraceae bacterium]
MKTEPFRIPRRSFLRGLGVTMALPLLDVMRPARTFAALAGVPKNPVRMAFLFVPNGAHMQDWTPLAEGADFDLPYILQPLQAHKSELLVMSGLSHDKAWANGDGGGDHARSAGSWLTGAQPLKSEGSQIRVGISADQVAAEALGKQTRFPSLELGLEPGRQGGKCDTGYSCAYSNNISWINESTPGSREINPRLVFERLFSSELPKEVGEGKARREQYRKSILDFVLEDAKSLTAKVGGNDKQKLDEYLTSVREIERRIESAEKMVAAATPAPALGYEIPEGIPESYEQHARLMMDMLVLAFQTDTTRVSTFMLANEGSNRSYRNIGVSDGHHSLSHHQGDRAKQEKIRDINHFHMLQFAYLLDRLKSIPEGEGTLLDNCMIVYGGGIGDGNRHNHNDLPLVMAGRGGGTITPGRHLRYAAETPMCNLLVSMLERVGVPVMSHGDSTGALRGLDA